MLPREMMTAGEARKRINAIKQYSSLGAGFKIAMRDLEIRGAGNILGTAQSGHIITVGFDLYCSLLRQAIEKMKGEKVQRRVDVALRIDFVASREAEYLAKNSEVHAPAFLPVSYITDSQSRIQAYRKLNELGSQEQLDQLRGLWRDRYGKFPEAVENLLVVNQIKLAAVARKVASLEVRDGKLMMMRGGDYILVGGKFPRLSDRMPTERLGELLELIRKF
jgi:transcription-repair coupling factor (superfamily II helicase)